MQCDNRLDVRQAHARDADQSRYHPVEEEGAQEDDREDRVREGEDAIGGDAPEDVAHLEDQHRPHVQPLEEDAGLGEPVDDHRVAPRAEEREEAKPQHRRDARLRRDEVAEGVAVGCNGAETLAQEALPAAAPHGLAPILQGEGREILPVRAMKVLGRRVADARPGVGPLGGTIPFVDCVLGGVVIPCVVCPVRQPWLGYQVKGEDGPRKQDHPVHGHVVEFRD
mmetsp:Transcript_61892/g.191798  ORF Transcript_61892/g.191798 Transcript_61892/m.191798 type:complete len:224 (+) Transcript_61892:456-1127(+)